MLAAVLAVHRTNDYTRKPKQKKKNIDKIVGHRKYIPVQCTENIRGGRIQRGIQIEYFNYKAFMSGVR